MPSGRKPFGRSMCVGNGFAATAMSGRSKAAKTATTKKRMRRIVRPPFRDCSKCFPYPDYGGFTPADSAAGVDDLRDVGPRVERQVEQQDDQTGHDDVADGPRQPRAERHR